MIPSIYNLGKVLTECVLTCCLVCCLPQAMHSSMMKLSNKKAKLAADLRESVKPNPLSSVSVEMLTQLEEVGLYPMVTIITSLSHYFIHEHVLLQY